MTEINEDNMHAENRPVSQVLLIDLENYPSQINKLLHDLEQFSRVVICYANSGAKIPLDWLLPLTTTVNANKLQIVKMPNGGKNAADFGICFFAGALMAELPEHTHFVIMSDDSDLDHAVSLLKSQGRIAKRISARKEEKPTFLETTIPSSPIKTYCKHLVSYCKNRPAKQDTLKNSIKNKFKDEPAVAESVFRDLTQNGLVTITNNKVTYNDKKILDISK